MRPRVRHLLFVSALLPAAASLLQGATVPNPQLPAPCNITVTTFCDAEAGTSAGAAYDGDRATFYDPEECFANQRFLVDFGCTGTFVAFRRYMTQNGNPVNGPRTTQEFLLYSGESGSIVVTRDNSDGWDAYAPLIPGTFAGVPYDSPWVRLNNPAPTRRVAFEWFGSESDVLNEVEIEFHYPPLPPCPPGAADLSVSLCGTVIAEPKDVVGFTATVTNRGPEVATGVVLRPIRSAERPVLWTSPVICTEGNADVSGDEECDLGSLAPGASATAGFVLVPPVGTGITEVAVTGGLPDCNALNNFALQSTSKVNCVGVTPCPFFEFLAAEICDNRLPVSSCSSASQAQRQTLFSRTTAALRGLAARTALRAFAHALGIDLGIFHRLREEVFPQTPAGRRYIELYDTHGPEISGLILANPALRNRGRATLELWEESLGALVEGRGGEASVTAQQVAELEGVLADLKGLGSPELRSVIEREQALLNLPSYVGLPMDDALERFQQPGCLNPETSLCLQNGRFRATVSWRDFQGRTGVGRAVPLTSDTGYFWFFRPENVELMMKVLDGRAVNNRFWVFFGALSSVQYTLRVEDTVTGAVKTYRNRLGKLASVGDTMAFAGTGDLPPALAAPPPAAAVCSAEGTSLCLNGGRFEVTVTWRDFQGRTGTGRAVDLTSDTGYFWFFRPQNVELVIKTLDGRLLNRRFWVFYGALSSVEYTITVRDRNTGAVKTYRNPSGRLASVADTSAF